MSEQITERYVVSLDYPYINIDHGKSVGKKVGSVNFECEFEGPKAFCPLEHLKGESVGRIFDTVKISLESEPSPTNVIVYEGNLTDQFIQDVRAGKYDVFEGVVCKGTQRTGAHRGNVWMAKIKTQKYLDLLKGKFGETEAKKYGE